MCVCVLSADRLCNSKTAHLHLPALQPCVTQGAQTEKHASPVLQQHAQLTHSWCRAGSAPCSVLNTSCLAAAAASTPSHVKRTLHYHSSSCHIARFACLPSSFSSIPAPMRTRSCDQDERCPAAKRRQQQREGNAADNSCMCVLSTCRLVGYGHAGCTHPKRAETKSAAMASCCADSWLQLKSHPCLHAFV